MSQIELRFAQTGLQKVKIFEYQYKLPSYDLYNTTHKQRDWKPL